jgi:hypothetical protein
MLVIFHHRGAAACVSTRRSTGDSPHVKIGLECAQAIESFGRGTLSYRPLVRKLEGQPDQITHPYRFLVTSGRP